MPKYDSLELSVDAVAFAKSRFGQHYLARLKRLRDEHLALAMNDEYSDSYRAHRASKAAALDAEIEFFTIAQTVQNSPDIIKRIKKKLRGGDAKEDV